MISLDNLAFSFVTWSNLSLDRALTPVLAVASMVPGINKGADHAWVDSQLLIGALSMEYSGKEDVVEQAERYESLLLDSSSDCFPLKHSVGVKIVMHLFLAYQQYLSPNCLSYFYAAQCCV